MPNNFLTSFFVANFLFCSGFDSNSNRVVDVTAGSSNTEGSFHQIGWWSENHENEMIEPYEKGVPSLYNLTNNHGLVMLVIHERSKHVLLHKVFPTWNAFTFSTDLVWWLSRIQKKRIVVLYVKKSGIYGLNQAVSYFKRRGASFIEFLPANALWIWVWVIGGKTLVEVATSVKNEFHVSKIIANINYEVSSNYEIISNSPIDKSIKEFCETIEGMGDLCSNEIPPIYPSHASKVNLSEREKTANLQNKNFLFGIVVCAGHRPQYLWETLKSLLWCREVKYANIFVVVGLNFSSGEPDQLTLRLLDLLMIPYQVAESNHETNGKSANNQNFFFYKEAWKRSLSAFPEARYLTFIDEDVVVQEDWMSFLLHAAPALDMDYTLWCVTGTSAFPNGGTEGRLLRGWRQVGWGYLIRRQEVSEAVKLWPNHSNYSLLYDTWLLKTITRYRDCIYPEISYSHHFGVGVNTEPFLHQRYFLEEDFNKVSNKKFSSIQDLLKNKYFNDTWNAINNAIPLQRDPCEEGFFSISKQFAILKRDFVFYYYLDDIWEAPTWTFLAECIGAWPYSTHGMFEGVLKFPVEQGRFYIYFVGTPLSPYSVLKPRDYRMWKVPKGDTFLYKQLNFITKFVNLPNFQNRSFKNLENIFSFKHLNQ